MTMTINRILVDNEKLVNSLAFRCFRLLTQKDKDNVITEKDIISKFIIDNDLTDYEDLDFTKMLQLMHVRVLQEGGILFDKAVLDYETFEDYLESIKSRRKAIRKAISDRWVGNSKARRYFVDEKPETKEAIWIADKKEYATDIIEEYYDENFFTWSNLKKGYILIKERDYGGENRIGICINQEPYSTQFTITVRGIVGGYNICNEGNGWDMELEKGAKRFSISKTYSGTKLPMKYELINDICVYDVLEKQPPTGKIVKDTGIINIYPTSREYFK